MNAFFNINNFYVDIISIIIVVSIIIAMIVGATRGFLKQIISFGKVFLVLALAILLCKPLGELIYKTGLGNVITNSIEGSLLKKTDMMSTLVTLENSDTILSQGLKELSVPGFFTPIVSWIIRPFVPASGGETIGYYISFATSSIIMYSIAFIVIILIGSIVVSILKKLAKVIHKAPVIGAFDKFFGVVLSAFVCYIIIDAILYGSSFILLNSNLEVSKWLSQTLYLDNDSVLTLSKFIYQNSIVRMLVQSL